MATPETLADDLAAKLASAEAAAADVTKSVKQIVSALGLGPFTQKRLILKAQAAQSAIHDLHADLDRYDPRPRPFDGGGK